MAANNEHPVEILRKATERAAAVNTASAALGEQLRKEKEQAQQSGSEQSTSGEAA